MFTKKDILKINTTLTYDGVNWVVFNESFKASGNSLEELDNQVKNELKKQGILPSSKKIQVFMACDNEIIPGWMRPFHNHYFNRILEINK